MIGRKRGMSDTFKELAKNFANAMEKTTHKKHVETLNEKSEELREHKRKKPDSAKKIQANYPPKAQPLDQLTFAEAEEELRNERAGKIAKATRKRMRETEEVDQLAKEELKHHKGEQNKDKDEESAPSYAEPMMIEKEYVFKTNSPDNPRMIEMEAYSAAVCKFLATQEYVSTVRAYYGKNGYVGIASKFMPDFVTNFKDPLTVDDTLINCLLEAHLRRDITGLTSTLLKEHTLTAQPKASFAGNIFGSFVSTDVNRMNFRVELSAFLAAVEGLNGKALTNDLLKDGIGLINLRIQTLDQTNAENTFELTRLKQLSRSLQDYLAIEEEQRDPANNWTLEELEQASQHVQDNDIDIYALKDNYLVTVNVDGQERQIRADDIRAYDRARALGTTLTTRYLQKEGDANNTNMSKDGSIVDFGLTKLDAHYQLMDMNKFDAFVRSEHASTLKCTERDVRNFPDLHDTKAYYWPTRESQTIRLILNALSYYLQNHDKLVNEDANAMQGQINQLINSATDSYMAYRSETQSYVEAVTGFASNMVLRLQAYLQNKTVEEITQEEARKNMYGFANSLLQELVKEKHDEIRILDLALATKSETNKNQFSASDRRDYRALATHPVVEFFKFKTMLKYILTDGAFYGEMAKLFIHDHLIAFYKPDGTYVGRLPSEALAELEQKNIDEVREVLTKMPEFHEFMQQHGEFAFNMIMDELRDFAESRINKINADPECPYKDMVETLNLMAVEDRYNELAGNRAAMRVSM